MPMKTVNCRVRASGPMQRLELDAGKLARPVLRGPGGSNAIRLPDQALETKARFITQVMAGESGVRRADDIGGQELSYAEVKAIASGNPAVLTLAEADAELQRLAVLRKNHADEQFLARRACRELPETIARLTRRINDLESDRGTISEHTDSFDFAGIMSGASDNPDILSGRLKTLPERVKETTRIPLGRYRGLSFGITMHAGGAAEVYLQGKLIRQTLLSRENRGPRAVTNALERLALGYEGEEATARRDLGIAQGQLGAHGERLGKPFLHASYQAELGELRDRLREALSSTAEQKPDSGASAHELSEAILALKASRSVEALPESRNGTPRAERPVTSRIRERRKPAEIRPSGEPEEDLRAASTDETPEMKPAATPDSEKPRVSPLPVSSARERPQGKARQGRLF